MTRDDFRELFLRALNAAAENAERRLSRSISRSFLIELHTPTSVGRLVDVEEALDGIYLGNDRFYQIIDIAIKKLLPKESVAFVRVSGHAPVEFDHTWDPSDTGPFKQVLAANIEDRHADRN